MLCAGWAGYREPPCTPNCDNDMWETCPTKCKLPPVLANNDKVCLCVTSILMTTVIALLLGEVCSVDLPYALAYVSILSYFIPKVRSISRLVNTFFIYSTVLQFIFVGKKVRHDHRDAHSISALCVFRREDDYRYENGCKIPFFAHTYIGAEPKSLQIQFIQGTTEAAGLPTTLIPTIRVKGLSELVRERNMCGASVDRRE